MSTDASNPARGISPQRLINRRSLAAYGLPEGFYTLACAPFAHLCAWSHEAGPGSGAEKTFAPADGSNGLLLKNAHQILSVDVLVKRFR